jgi:hypothetical protein
MVMALPAMVADSVAGGLFGGPGWANTVAAAMRRPVQTKRLFMAMFLLRAERLLWMDCLDAKIVAPNGPVGEAGLELPPESGLKKRGG